MKLERVLWVMVAAGLWIGGKAFAQPAPAGAGAPEIQFETPVFDFGKALMGEEVQHDFVFTNTGSATLIVSNVEPKCGCTVTKPWTREVEPGKTGIIPITLRTSGLINGPATKYVGVKCNAKVSPETILQMKGTIYTLIEMIPPRPVLTMISDTETNAVAVVKILNHGETAVELSELKCSNPGVTAKLRTVTPGKEFELTLETVPPVAPGNSEAVVTLKTSLPQLPVLTVQGLLFSRAALMVTPSTLMVPHGPLTEVTTGMIQVYNLSTAHPTLTLSTPAVNAAGVGVKMREDKAGKHFELMLTFPPGFEVPKGSNVEVTVKSSHPQFGVIRVPVVERPADMMPRRPKALNTDGPLHSLPARTGQP